MLRSRDIILVPKGAEYGAVCRGVARRTAEKPRVVAIAIGSIALRDFLREWKQSLDFLNKRECQIVLVGLAGSLVDRYRVGDVVSYRGCGRENGEYSPCSVEWTEYPRVKGLTGDRVIVRSIEKRELGRRTGYDVVDMEGSIVLEALNGLNVGVIRVISDAVGQDLPEIQGSIDANGDLQPVPLAIAMIQRPIAAFHLIRGSLRALQVLQEVARNL